MSRPETDPPQHSADQAASFAILLQQRPLKMMAEAAGTTACHLVGGALRDTALGLGYRDLDLVVESDGLSIAQRLASSLPARLVELGGDRFAAYRLVAHDLTLDIWDRRGDSIGSRSGSSRPDHPLICRRDFQWSRRRSLSWSRGSR